MTIASPTVNTTSPIQGTSHQRGHKPPSMDNTATALGLSTDDLQSQLKSGKTLNDVAKAQGVSSDDLLKAFKSDLAANKPADAPALGDDQLTQWRARSPRARARTAQAATVAPPPRKGDGNGDDTASNLSTLAGNLGLSSDELLEKLQSGTNANSLWGASTNNPYAAAKFNVPGGVAVDTYA